MRNIKLTDTAIEVPKTVIESIGLNDVASDLIKAYKRLAENESRFVSSIRIEVLASQLLDECDGIDFGTGILLATLRGYALGRKMADKECEFYRQQIDAMEKKILKLEKNKEK